MTQSTNKSVLELIGNTPMVKISKIDTGVCELYVKLENQNPGGSIKDRIALTMIEAAEKSGSLKSGGTIGEATAGNTGLSLALVARQKGYKLVLVIPDKMSREKIFHLKAMGAEVLLTRSDVGKGHPEYYQDVAERISKERGAFYVNQFANPANPEAHEVGTAPEIFEQMDGRIDAIVAGVGSGGTLTGLGRYFAKHSPHTEMVLADPAGSILCEVVEKGKIISTPGSWLVEGVGEDFIPPNCDLSRVKHAETITDAESFDMARSLLINEGIFGGSSSGTLVAAAIKYCKKQTKPKRVVTFICDSGNKYLSKMYNDYWMTDQGFVKKETYGDLRDVISRRQWENAVVSVNPNDTLAIAMARMKLYDISQLPVMQGNTIVGMIDESDVILSVLDSEKAQSYHFKKTVGEAMCTRLVTLSPKAAIKDLLPIFDQGQVAIVVDNNQFLGLITKIDLLNYLRQKQH